MGSGRICGLPSVRIGSLDWRHVFSRATALFKRRSVKSRGRRPLTVCEESLNARVFEVASTGCRA